MCGIVGIVNYKEDISNQYPILRNMTNTLERRGPDEEGFFFSQNVNFGHRRLNVIDIENGKQPMSFTYNDTTYTITYNGQIYNTKELKAELIKKGFSFKGHSDTEILLKAYILYGKEICNHLNGIFAFAIYNDKEKDVFIARDQFGIKPLYYSTIGDNFIFASEIKAILEHPKATATLDKIGISELFGIGPSHTPRLYTV